MKLNARRCLSKKVILNSGVVIRVLPWIELRLEQAVKSPFYEQAIVDYHVRVKDLINPWFRHYLTIARSLARTNEDKMDSMNYLLRAILCGPWRGK
jgi:hypothetical protein